MVIVKMNVKDYIEKNINWSWKEKRIWKKK